jgi:hypothetical protein
MLCLCCANSSLSVANHNKITFTVGWQIKSRARLFASIDRGNAVEIMYQRLQPFRLWGLAIHPHK